MHSRYSRIRYQSRNLSNIKDVTGNIEAELTYTLNKIISGQELSEMQDGDSVGCGCAYPPYVGDATVANSNQIMNDSLGISETNYPPILKSYLI